MSGERFSVGQTVFYTNTKRPELMLGRKYTVRVVNPSGRTIRLEGVPGVYNALDFTAAASTSQLLPFGTIKAVTVTKADVLHTLSAYVRDHLGIDATVEKIIQKFPDAIELVLRQEADHTA